MAWSCDVIFNLHIGFFLVFLIVLMSFFSFRTLLSRYRFIY